MFLWFHGNITSDNSFGTNELIKQGAKCITEVEEVLEEIDKQLKFS